MIKIENVTFRYDRSGEPVLNRINTTIDEGEYIGIVGPNGCGKTTLVQHLNALLYPATGRVSIDGMSTDDESCVEEIRRRVGMVFQNPDNQIVGMTVEEDIAFGPGNLGLPSPEIRQRVDESLARVGLKNHANRQPHTLSGGEKRLVSIAGILAMKPRYIIFDEPTSYLDPSGRDRILSLIEEINKQGIAIIHITHNMDEIVNAGRIIVMNEGRIAFAGSPREVFGKVEQMKVLKLNIPVATDLAWRLKQRGEDIRTDILTIDEVCSEISNRLQNFHAS
jgi:biotin transport system ATP-binding protein/energy-coupling factor transport system ATP-binding protein